MPEPSRDEAILAELAAFARRGEPELLQFGSLAAAYQYRRLYHVWRRFVPAGAEVLDWGAGNGHFSYFLSRAGYRATGYSFLPYLYEHWLADPSYRFVAGNERDPVTLPFDDASFDAVASIGVLEHVRETGGDEAKSLAEIARVLRPGGHFVAFHFPNQASWIDLAARRVPAKHHHLYRYGRGDIERLVRGAGLDLLETRRYALLPRNTLHRVLGSWRDTRWSAEAWDRLDAVLSVLANPIVQNHYFVARKPAEPARG
jgi:SAM-dependent methyltransferase